MVLKCVTGIIKYVNKKCEICICLFIYHCIVQNLFARPMLCTRLFFFEKFLHKFVTWRSIARYDFKLENF